MLILDAGNIADTQTTEVMCWADHAIDVDFSDHVHSDSSPFGVSLVSDKWCFSIDAIGELQ